MYQYQAEIQRVVDGDTYVIDIDLGLSIWARGETVRLYGVDTPEVYGVKKDSDEYVLGKASSDFAKLLAPKGTLSIVDTIKDTKEKYGRYLAILYIPVPEEILEGHENIRTIGNLYCLNDLLIAKGLAKPYLL
jgi:micrococcal nuclease